jgi:hypothetical protein
MNKSLKPLSRSDYFGSSDAADIARGLESKVYNEKVGNTEREDLSHNFKVQLGKHVEPFHLDWLCNEVHPEWEWSQIDETQPKIEQHFATIKLSSELGNPFYLGSHPDALLRLPSKEVYPLEAKHTGAFPTADEAAQYYMPQLQHHMICWKKDRLAFSVIVGNQDPEVIWVGYSESWAEWYIGKVSKMADMIATRTPPPISPEYLSDTVKVPREVAATVPLNGMKQRILADDNNYALTTLATFNRTKTAVAEHEQAKKDLKAIVADDESKVELPGKLILKRNAKGSVLITVKDTDYGREE